MLRHKEKDLIVRIDKKYKLDYIIQAYRNLGNRKAGGLYIIKVS
jgi:hypothetical protein